MNGSNELKRIEKEIIETRALIIKSNNLTNSLSADVRSIAKRQSTYERNLSAGNFVVYIIFAVMALVGAHLVYNARQAPLNEKLTEAQNEAEAARQELGALKKEIGKAPEQGEESLKEIFALITEGDRQGTIDAYEKLNPKRLSFLERKLLERTVEQFRSELSMKHYIAATGLVDANKYPEAIEEFKISLTYKDNAGHSKAARIQMANALRLEGKPTEAIAILQKVTEEHLDRELADDALWYLAKCHKDAHQKDEALSVLKALMRRHPDSQYYRAARIMAAELKLRMWRDDE